MLLIQRECLQAAVLAPGSTSTEALINNEVTAEVSLLSLLLSPQDYRAVFVVVMTGDRLGVVDLRIETFECAVLLICHTFSVWGLCTGVELYTWK